VALETPAFNIYPNVLIKTSDLGFSSVGDFEDNDMFACDGTSSNKGTISLWVREATLKAKAVRI
jgi:hypothetical protein